MKLKTILVALSVILAVSISLFYVFKESKREQSISWPEIQKQEVVERKFENTNFTLRWRVKDYRTEAKKNLLYHIWGLDIDQNKNVYALDFGRMVVLKFDSTGNYLAHYGEGRGGGPGEFKNISGFSVDAENRVWICDPPQNRISCFNSRGEHLFDLNPDVLVTRAGDVRNRIVAKVAQLGLPMFAVLNQDAGIEQNFGWLHPLQERDTKVVFEGPVVLTEQGIYAFFFRLPFFAKIDYNGQLVYLRAPVGKHELPVIHTMKVGEQVGTWIDQAAPWITISASVDVDAGKIFLLSPPVQKNGKSVIDVYSEADGEYLYSFMLPEKVRIAKIRHSVVYAAQDTLISSWRIAQ